MKHIIQTQHLKPTECLLCSGVRKLEISTTVDAELKSHMERLARADHRSVADIARLAIIYGLPAVERKITMGTTSVRELDVEQTGNATLASSDASSSPSPASPAERGRKGGLAGKGGGKKGTREMKQAAAKARWEAERARPHRDEVTGHSSEKSGG